MIFSIVDKLVLRQNFSPGGELSRVFFAKCRPL